MKFFGLSLVLLALAFSQLLIGGTRLLYSIPAYGLIALVGICAIVPKWRRNGHLPMGCLLTSLIFCGYVLARSWVSPVDYLARTDFFIVVGSLMIYLLTALFYARPADRLFVISGLLVLALAHGVVGAVQFKEGNQFYPWPWIQRSDYGWRASGFYICPNHLAGLLEVVALFALSLTIWSKRGVTFKVLAAYVGGWCCHIGSQSNGWHQ